MEQDEFSSEEDILTKKNTEIKKKLEEIDSDELIYDISSPSITLMERIKNTLYETEGVHIKALGDIHGWAPGLINFLIENQLAKIWIDSIPLFSIEKRKSCNNDKEKNEIENGAEADQSEEPILKVNSRYMNHFFPHPINYRDANGVFPKNKFTLAGFYENDPDSLLLKVSVEWIGPDDVIFVQMGDIFDRGDFSELSAEILRQMLIQAPGRVFILMGNHEQFLLENEFSTWLNNEIKFNYSPEKQEMGFHTRFDMETNGWGILDEEIIKKEIFENYQRSCMLLYLTQYCVHGLLFPEILLRYPPIDPLKIIGERVAVYNYAKSFSLESTSFPGAIVFFGIGHTVFMHAEPNSFQQVKVFELKENCIKLQNSFGNFILSYYRGGKSKLFDSPDYYLLWQRDGTIGVTAKSPQPKALLGVSRLLRVFPGVSHIVHGHTPTISVQTFVELSGNFPISYLSRNYGERVTRRTGNVRIHMIDEGYTPVYYSGSLDMKFDPCRVPIGLHTHPDLAQYHFSNPDKIEKTIEEWRKVITPEKSKPFFIPETLVILEPNSMGRISPGSALWAPLPMDKNEISHRFPILADNNFPKYCLYRQNSNLAIGAKGLSWMLYQKNLVLEEPEKVYLLSTKKNCALDRYLFDYTNEETLKWLELSQKGLPIPILNSEVIANQIAGIFNAEKKLKSIFSDFKQIGINTLFQTGKVIYSRLGLNQKGQVFVLILNFSEMEVNLQIQILNNPNILFSEMIPAMSFRFKIFDPKYNLPVMIDWRFINTEEEFTVKSPDDLVLWSETEALDDYFRNTRIIGGIAWFSEKMEIQEGNSNLTENLTEIFTTFNEMSQTYFPTSEDSIDEGDLNISINNQEEVPEIKENDHFIKTPMEKGRNDNSINIQRDRLEIKKKIIAEGPPRTEPVSPPRLLQSKRVPRKKTKHKRKKKSNNQKEVKKENVKHKST
jgi:hypothetical protein